MKFIASLMVAACAVAASAVGSSPDMFKPETAPVRAYFNALREKMTKKKMMEVAADTAAVVVVQHQKEVTLAATPTGTSTISPTTATPTAAGTTARPTTTAPTATAHPTTTPVPTNAPMEAPTEAPSGVEPLKSGYLNIIEGTATGCTPVTGVVRVALGVCVKSNSVYVMNYILPTATTGSWYQDQYSDAACATTPISHDLQAIAYRGGCGKLFLAGAAATGLLTTGVFSTISIDSGFDPVPAASLVPASWGYTAMWSSADACATPTVASPPTLLVAKPVAPNAQCPATVDCASTSSASPTYLYGPVTSVGCSTVTPQATGYFASLTWTGAPAEVRVRVRAWTRPRRTYHACPLLA